VTKLALIPIEVPREVTRGLQEGDEHTNQQRRNDSLEVMNATEIEWDQLDTRLERYDQNREQMMGRKSQLDIVQDFQTKSGIFRQSPVGGLGS
jgi:hypothetical protein